MLHNPLLDGEEQKIDLEAGNVILDRINSAEKPADVLNQTISLDSDKSGSKVFSEIPPARGICAGMSTATKAGLVLALGVVATGAVLLGMYLDNMKPMKY